MELRKNNYNYIYNSLVVKKFINNLAKVGKIQAIEIAFYKSLSNLKFKIKMNPFLLFLYLLSEIRPFIILKMLRLGSVTYQIPTPLAFRKQFFQAVKLLGKNIKDSKKSMVTIESKIETALWLIVQGTSPLFKRNQQLYQHASNARAFAHYRWD